MKKLIGFTCAIALVTIGSVYAEEVNFHAANPVLQSLVDAVTSADELVDFAYPRFDEAFCDVKAEKLKYDLQGSIKNTPWLDGGHADATASSTYVADRTPGHSGLTMSAKGTVRTDVLAMIRYAGYIALRRTSDHDIYPKFRERYLAHFKRLAVVTSLEQVQTLLISGQSLAKDMVVYEIQKREDYLHCVETGECPNYEGQIDYEKKMIAQWKNTLPSYDRVQIEVKKEGDKVRELIVSSPEMSGFIPRDEIDEHDFYIVPGKGRITFSDYQVSAETEAFHKISLANMDRLKGTLMQNLIGVQNGSAGEKDIAQAKFREALIAFKNAIRGEWK
ncbi:hypothetical protein WDW37_04290 [Bdellovibrionota bacterium FG-1]